MDVEFRDQSKLLDTLPVIYNVANLPKPAPGEPALISFDDVTTMFHEFGHALHGMLADSEYPSLSGTATARDFVEFPSQFNEHWALYPEVFNHYARHYKTGAPMPNELFDKIKRAENFNEGYKLTEASGRRRTRHAVAYVTGECAATESGRIRKAGSREDSPRHPCRAAPVSLELLQSYMEQRLFGRLLCVSVDARCSRTMPTSGSMNTAD